MADPAAQEYPPEVEEDLALLRRLRGSIEGHLSGLDTDYAARLAAFRRLRDAGVRQEPIAEAAGVGPSAGGGARHEARRKERLASMTQEEQAAARAQQERARRRRTRPARPA